MSTIKSISLLFVSCFFIFQSCKTAKPVNETTVLEENNKALLWKISGNGLERSSYLFGTFHIKCKEDEVIGQLVKDAIASSDEVWFEVNLTDTLQMMQAIGNMNMKGGERLKNLLSAEQYGELSAKFNEMGMGLASLDRFLPFLASGMIVSKWLTCNDISGVDLEILQVAKANSKPIKGFETLSDQLEIFHKIPYKKQAEALYESVTDSSQKSKMEEIYTAYLDKDLERVAEVMNSEPEMIEYKEILLDNRNFDWLKQLKTTLQNKSVFIAVGAGHLVEDEGMISLLRKEGYEVKPMN